MWLSAVASARTSSSTSYSEARSTAVSSSRIEFRVNMPYCFCIAIFWMTADFSLSVSDSFATVTGATMATV